MGEEGEENEPGVLWTRMINEMANRRGSMAI